MPGTERHESAGRWWAAGAAALVAAIVLAVAPTPATAATTAAVGSRPLAANVLAGLGALTSAPADPATPMVVGVALQRPHPAGERAVYRSLYRAASPDYRRFLTPARFAARFGVPAPAFGATVAWLRAGGLAVEETSRSRDYVLATGPVAAVEKVFATTIRRYQSGTTSFLANTAAPAVPAGLPVLSVVGLNTYQRFSAPAHAAAPLAAPLAGLLALPGVPNLFTTTPQDLWSVYDQPDAYRGAGQRIAVFGSGASDGAIADLAQFERQNHLPAVPVTVTNVGPGPFTDTSGAAEWDIDTQASTGMAPDAAGLTLYFGSTLVDATVEA
ncbi:MAG TPA: protease pro-enzyme activation domain-containing protein, partial [Solirubrobacteraceae bacterium]|nr:protease pro-enzyme activation domain-containing protein [Solirubrobacteraceae bacterium]